MRRLFLSHLCFVLHVHIERLWSKSVLPVYTHSGTQMKGWRRMLGRALTEGGGGVQFSGGQVGSGEVSALVVVVLHVQRAQFGEVDPQRAAAVIDVLTVQRLKDSSIYLLHRPTCSRRAPDTNRKRIIVGPRAPSPQLYAHTCAGFYECACDSRPWRAEHAWHRWTAAEPETDCSWWKWWSSTPSRTCWRSADNNHSFTER